MTAEDFHAADEAFKAQDRSTPTMSDFENAMGLSASPDWRTALRYQEIVRLYQGGVVADIGCGDGRLCWLYNICSPEKYYGIDSGGLVKVLAERTSGRAHAINGVAEATGLPDEYVDLVVCTEVFEHLTDPARALREFCRLLKPGGRIVIQSPSARRLRNLNPFHVATIFLGRWFPSVLQRTVVHENTFIRAFTYHWDFTRQDFRNFVQGLPLKIESVRGAMYRFNPNGNVVHRLAYRIACLPIVNSMWWDLTFVLRKS
jgi:ubiquinone/menaquinone biosynthesis C-methylase UbiE